MSVGRGSARNIGHRSQTTGQLVPAARRVHGILTGISEFKADVATLKLIYHRVGFGLTEKKIWLQPTSPYIALSQWWVVGGTHGLDPQHLDLTRNHSASIGKPVDFEYHRLYWDTKEAVCKKVSISCFE